MLDASRSQTRVQSIDILRGAVMAIMALDHVREFFHSAVMTFSPEDLTRTTPAIFLTRWTTHFCAPVFMLTAGMGAFLWSQRAKSKKQVSWFLFTRGLWLIVLELTVGRLALTFNFDYSNIILVVLWALGCSMIALAALVYLPPMVLAGVSMAMIALHDMLDGVKASQFGSAAWIWNVLHQLGTFHWGRSAILVAYPLIPWIGVMAAGYSLGRVFLLPPERRQRVLIRLGAGLTVGFLLLRALNIYGDPVRWSTQHSPLFTVLSFLKCSKYPPSLDFLLMTLGPALAVMGWLERVRLSAMNPLLIFGRVPLFYYLVHLFLIHGMAIALVRTHGYDLWGCYIVWVGVLVVMYPLCRWFARLKERRRDWWLSYL